MAAGSIPFVVLLSRLSHWFGFRKRDGILLGLVLTAEVLLLPFALRSNMIVWWVGFTTLTVGLSPLWLTKKPQTPEKTEIPVTPEKVVIPESQENTEIPDSKDGTITECSPAAEYTVEFRLHETSEAIAIVEQTQETIELERAVEPVKIVEYVTHEISLKEEAAEPELTVRPEITVEPEITLEDLINCGFTAKNAGRFQSAAEWFSRALSLHPAPDLACYLIMDACNLWLAVNKRDNAQELLAYYWQEYADRFAPEQQTQMILWLSKENLLG